MREIILKSTNKRTIIEFTCKYDDCITINVSGENGSLSFDMSIPQYDEMCAGILNDTSDICVWTDNIIIYIKTNNMMYGKRKNITLQRKSDSSKTSDFFGEIPIKAVIRQIDRRLTAYEALMLAQPNQGQII